MKPHAPLCLLLFTLLVFHSQLLKAEEPRLSVTSSVGHACGESFPAATLQQDLEGQLRAAGFAVSRVHSAGLSADFECVPVEASKSAENVAVHQCLSLSQVVSVPSQANGLKLATTWRNCQAYTCRGAACAAFARTGQRSQVDEFLVAFRDLNTKHEVTPAAARQEASMGGAPSSFYVEVSKPVYVLSMVFYVVYILTCLAVLVRWKWAR